MATRTYEITFKLLNGQTKTIKMPIPVPQLGSCDMENLEQINIGSGLTLNTNTDGTIATIEGDGDTFKCYQINDKVYITKSVTNASVTIKSSLNNDNDNARNKWYLDEEGHYYATFNTNIEHALDYLSSKTISVTCSSSSSFHIDCGLSADGTYISITTDTESNPGLQTFTYSYNIGGYYSVSINTLNQVIEYLYKRSTNWTVTEDSEGSIVFNPVGE